MSVAVVVQPDAMIAVGEQLDAYGDKIRRTLELEKPDMPEECDEEYYGDEYSDNEDERQAVVTILYMVVAWTSTLSFLWFFSHLT